MTEKNKGGRPTKYEGDETLALVYKYIECDYMIDGDVLPTEEGLASYLGVCTSTIDNWEEAHNKFLGALKRLKDKQRRILVNQGLIGTFQPTIAKLILSANHGVNETSNSNNKNVNIDASNPPSKEDMKKIDEVISDEY